MAKLDWNDEARRLLCHVCTDPDCQACLADILVAFERVAHEAREDEREKLKRD